MTIILVRHAMPLVDPAVPPAQWELSDQGRAAAALLRFPTGACRVASAEPKAWQTIGAEIRDPRFNEVRRVGEPFGDDFRVLRRSYVEGLDHDGWEPRDEVVRRFDEGIASYPDRPLVIATHGMAMTVWLTARAGLADPGAFWAALGFPHVYETEVS